MSHRSRTLIAGALLLAAGLLPSGAALAQSGSGLCAGQPTSTDGQCLASQPPATQAAFNGSWGAQAAQEWVTEHNASVPTQPQPAPAAPPAAPAPAPAPAAPAPTPGSSGTTAASGLPTVGIESPFPNEDLGLANGTFTMLGYAFDPRATVSQTPGVDRVDVYIYAQRNAAGSVQLGSTVPNGPDPHAGNLFGPMWQSNTRWRLSYALNTLNPGYTNLYVYAHSAITGNSAMTSEGVSIVNGTGD